MTSLLGSIPEPNTEDLRSTVLGTLSQVLFKEMCGHCAIRYWSECRFLLSSKAANPCPSRLEFSQRLEELLPGQGVFIPCSDFGAPCRPKVFVPNAVMVEGPSLYSQVKMCKQGGLPMHYGLSCGMALDMLWAKVVIMKDLGMLEPHWEALSADEAVAGVRIRSHAPFYPVGCNATGTILTDPRLIVQWDSGGRSYPSVADFQFLEKLK